MKSKQLLRTLAAFCTALVLMGGFSVPAYAGGGEEPADGTNDSNVQVEQPEETPPLTPDGNATLVDDYGGNKQLITVTTKNGNYFYILVDRDDEGENTVHFLNQVDEADLMRKRPPPFAAAPRNVRQARSTGTARSAPLP